MTIEAECPVCYGPCDAEIHGATLRVRAWMRKSLMRRLAPLQKAAPKPKPRKPGEPANKLDLSPSQIAKLRLEGNTLDEIAAILHCSRRVVSERLREWGASEDRRRGGRPKLQEVEA